MRKEAQSVGERHVREKMLITQEAELSSNPWDTPQGVGIKKTKVPQIREKTENGPNG